MPSFNKLAFVLLITLACTMPTTAQEDATVGTTRPPNPEIKDLPRAPGVRAAPPKYSDPADYSGVSGPGQPVVGTGLGGYRTGRDGVMYKGPEPKKSWLPLGDRAKGTAVTDGLLPSLRPIWDLHLRDTQICRGEDDFYYMTGSTGDNIWDLNDGVELYRSKDLRSWDYLGLVWSVDKDGTWEKNLRYVWAPEIHIIHHQFVITYCMSGGDHGGTGILVSTKPEGPYTNPLTDKKPLTGGIDGTIFEDDDGKVYFTNGAGGTLHLMKADLSGYDGPAITTKIVKPDDNRLPQRLGHEGVAMFKANGKYYLSAADTFQGRYSSICARADHIEGPYVDVHEAVPCGAGGGYFQTTEGTWFCTLFGNDAQSPWREKPGLVQIDFDAGGNVKIADNQPAWLLQPGAPTHWRKPAAPSDNGKSATTAPSP